MPTLGPLDRRILRKRCVACAKRKIKCEGEPPCLYCTKKKQKCIPQVAAQKNDAVFVNTCAVPLVEVECSLTVVTRKISTMHTSILKLYSAVPLESSNVFIGHFFSGFLAANDFGGSLDLDTVISQFQSSPSLYYASIAVGALDLSNKLPQVPAVERKDARVGALNAYRTSIVSVQKDLNNSDIRQSDASLWTTFFLGLFELMYDDTGEGFVKHFLYGTSKILQLRGPDAHISGAGRSFFLTVRVFEICRALIYAHYLEPTFLCQSSWTKLTENIRNESEIWHPKEVLFDLMISCSSLGNRVWKALKLDVNYTCTTSNTVIQELAAEGLLLRDSLNKWCMSFQQWINVTGSHPESGQSILATLYFHAISIFLSGIFDYRCEFNHILSPRLPQRQIQNHVDTILSDTRIALKTTNLGGVLFFFPLRVAGARVTSNKEANAILVMLDEISKRSFVVAEAFVSDLRAIWLEKGL